MQTLPQDNGVLNTILPLKLHVTSVQHAVGILSYITNCSPYLAYSGGVLEHILHSSDLTHKEKLFYLLADGLSVINGRNTTQQRSVALSSITWAKNLHCSKTEIFTMQKNLENKRYFVVVRDTNKFGKTKRNVIIPTIPDAVFHELCKSPDRFNIDKQHEGNLSYPKFLSSLSSASVAENYPCYVAAQSSKRSYLDRTKLFIKLNYQLLKLITSAQELTAFAKIVWLDFYSKCYKSHIKSKSSHSNYLSHDYSAYSLDRFEFIASYHELETLYSCNKATLSKTIKSLEDLGFISRKRFHVKNHNDNDNLHDKSLWTISLSLPEEYHQQMMELKPRESIGFEGDISYTDPYVSNIGHLYNKDLISNIKDLDNIEKAQKTSDDFVSTSSNLSVFLNNNQKVKKNYYNSDLRLTNPLVPNTKSLTSSTPSPFSKVGKFLKDFYPLTSKEVSGLNWRAGREFATNFGNQLMLKLARKYQDRTFVTRNHMLAYMTKAFRNEKHPGPLVNHDSFRFVVNIDDDTKHQEDIQKYLTEVEYNTDTSYPSQLRKKIIGAFESKTAYQLLTQGTFKHEEEKEKYDDNSYIISLPNSLKLTKHQKDTLENLVIAVYGFINISYERRKVYNYSGNKDLGNNTSSSNFDRVEIEKLDSNSIWYKIRKDLREELGENIDKSWLSKIKAEEDMNTQTLTLLAPSNFYRDWINGRYGYSIRRYCNELGYSFMNIDAIG